MKRWRKHLVFCLLAMTLLTMGAAARECVDCRYERPEPTEVRLEADAVVHLLGKPGRPEDADREGDEAEFEDVWETFRDSVWEGWTAGGETPYIDLSAYQFPYTAETQALFSEAISHAPELFALSKWQYRFYEYADGDVLAGITPIYNQIAATDGVLDQEKYDAAKKVYTDGIREIVEQVDPAWSDEAQLLFVHDYLAANYEYDMRVYDPELNDLAVRDAYNFFAQKTGVCQAYTMVYMAVLQELEFDVSYVESDHLNHIWNLVKVNGKWYHIDVTWDDPTEDMLGFAQHNYFLIDDWSSWLRHKHDGVENTDTPGHRFDWVYGVDVKCEDTRYLKDAVWCDAVSPFVFEEKTDLWYFVDSAGLRIWDGEDAEKPELPAPVDLFPEIRVGVPGFPGAYFPPCPDQPASAGLSLYDGKLFYNSRYTVRSYDPAAKTAETLLTLDWADVRANGLGFSLSEKQCMLSLRVDDGILSYETWSFELERWQYGEIVVRSKLTPVGEDVYSYRVEEGKLEVSLERGRVLVVTYDEKGAMSGMMICETSGVYDLPQGRVKLFAVDGEQGWNPLCQAVPL